MTVTAQDKPIANGRIYDTLTVMKDAGLIAASAAAQVSSADKILTVGNAQIYGEVVVDLTAVEIASNNEEYDILVQGSTSATFADTIENLGQLNLGATEVRQGGAIDSVTGRYTIPFTNKQADVIYPYIRLYTVVAGTIATGINYSAFLDVIRHVSN